VRRARVGLLAHMKGQRGRLETESGADRLGLTASEKKEQKSVKKEKVFARKKTAKQGVEKGHGRHVRAWGSGRQKRSVKGGGEECAAESSGKGQKGWGGVGHQRHDETETGISLKKLKGRAAVRFPGAEDCADSQDGGRKYKRGDT